MQLCPCCLNRYSRDDERHVLCPECYEAFSVISGDPYDVQVWRAVHTLLNVKDEQVMQYVSDSAGGTELLTDLFNSKDMNTARTWALKVIKRRSP